MDGDDGRSGNDAQPDPSWTDDPGEWPPGPFEHRPTFSSEPSSGSEHASGSSYPGDSGDSGGFGYPADVVGPRYAGPPRPGPGEPAGSVPPWSPGPPGPYAGYGYPYYGYPYSPARRTNGLAIGSLIAGIAAFAVCQLIGVVAIILGVMARRQIRENDEEGGSMAMAGIILGAVSTAITAILVLVVAGLLIATSSYESSSSGGPYLYPPTVPSTATAGTRPPGTIGASRAPSGVVAQEACPRVNLAFRNLMSPRDLTEDILGDAAATLHRELPASSADDIDTVFSDAMTRVGTDRAGSRSVEVQVATENLGDLIFAACPS